MKKNLDDSLSVKRIVRSKKLREKLGSEKYRMTRAFASWARSQQPTSRLAARLHDATDRRSPHRSCFGGSLMLMLLIRVAIFFSRAFSLDLFPSRCRFVCSNVISWFMQLAEKFIFFSRAMFSCRARRATKYVFFRVAFYYHHLLIIQEKTFLLFRGNIRRRSSHTSYDVTGRRKHNHATYDAISSRKGNCFHGQTGI